MPIQPNKRAEEVAESAETSNAEYFAQSEQ